MMPIITSGIEIVAAIAATIAAVFAVRAVRFCSAWEAEIRARSRASHSPNH
jgi:hypothetical protein